MSPDVFAADGSWRAHYKFPAVALSSITNRVTGVALTGAMSAGGVIALVGGPEAVPMTMEMFKANAPLAVVPVKFASWLTPSASGRGGDSMADEHLSLVDFRTSSYSSVTHRHPVRNAKKIRAVSNDGPMAGGPQLETFALFAGNIVLIFLPGWTVKACLACTSWEPRLKLILACATAVILGANSTVGLRQSRHGSPLATMMLGWGWFRSPLAAERVVSVVQWALCMAFLVTNLLTGM